MSDGPPTPGRDDPAGSWPGDEDPVTWASSPERPTGGAPERSAEPPVAASAYEAGLWALEAEKAAWQREQPVWVHPPLVEPAVGQALSPTAAEQEPAPEWSWPEGTAAGWPAAPVWDPSPAEREGWHNDSAAAGETPPAAPVTFESPPAAAEVEAVGWGPEATRSTDRAPTQTQTAWIPDGAPSPSERRADRAAPGAGSGTTTITAPQPVVARPRPTGTVRKHNRPVASPRVGPDPSRSPYRLTPARRMRSAVALVLISVVLASLLAAAFVAVVAGIASAISGAASS